MDKLWINPQTKWINPKTNNFTTKRNKRAIMETAKEIKASLTFDEIVGYLPEELRNIILTETKEQSNGKI